MKNVIETNYCYYNSTHDYSENRTENNTEISTGNNTQTVQEPPSKLSYDPYLIKYNEDTNSFTYNDPWEKQESAQSNEPQPVPSPIPVITNNANSCNPDNHSYNSADSHTNSPKPQIPQTSHPIENEVSFHF